MWFQPHRHRVLENIVTLNLYALRNSQEDQNSCQNTYFHSPRGKKDANGARNRARAKLDRFQDKEFIIHASGIRFFGSIFLEISDRIKNTKITKF